MTSNRRIFLNIVATYGRSVYSIILGLFTSRWILQSLGQVDYGLLGVVGALMGFVAFLNDLFASTIGRFYAFAVGRENVGETSVGGLVECQEIFSVAVMIHSVLPLVLITIGLPMGEWAVRHWLVVPMNRIEVCVWIWRFTCISCFVSMVTVPFRAMYTAKQEIAELTIYSFVQTTLNAIFIYIMVVVPRDWLFDYALWTCCILTAPLVVIAVRAIIKYPECRFRWTGVKNREKIKEIVIYAGSLSITAMSQMMSSNGLAVLINKLLGPMRNAAMTIGSNLSSKSLTLMNAFQGAMVPAITNAAGAGDYDRVRSLSNRTNVYTSLAVAVFALPLILEMDEVMRLWLRTPPDGSGNLCRCLLVAAIINQLTAGHVFAVFAKGRIFAFQLLESVVWSIVFFFSWCAICMGLDIVGVGIAWILMYSIDDVLKLYYGKKEIGLSYRFWLRHVAVPIVSICCVVGLIGCVPMFFLPQSFGRICITVGLCVVVLSSLTWFFVLNRDEKLLVVSRMSKWVRK